MAFKVKISKTKLSQSLPLREQDEQLYWNHPENLTSVLVLPTSAQTCMGWPGNTASICAAYVSLSKQRIQASLTWTE